MKKVEMNKEKYDEKVIQIMKNICKYFNKNEKLIYRYFKEIKKG